MREGARKRQTRVYQWRTGTYCEELSPLYYADSMPAHLRAIKCEIMPASPDLCPAEIAEASCMRKGKGREAAAFVADYLAWRR